MRVEQLLNLGELDQNIQDKYVVVQKHPTLPLYLYAYTDKCVLENKWDTVTSRCRDLVVEEGGTIIGNSISSSSPRSPQEVSIVRFKGQLIAAASGSFDSKLTRKTLEIIKKRPAYDACLSILTKECTVVCEVVGDNLLLKGTMANFDLADGRQLWIDGATLTWPEPEKGD